MPGWMYASAWKCALSGLFLSSTSTSFATWNVGPAAGTKFTVAVAVRPASVDA